MTEFFTDLIEKSGFDEALIRHALEFSKNIDTDDFSRLFFDKDCFIVENTGVLYFEEAFYPYEFYEKLKSLPLVPENASVYIYILLLERSFRDFCSRIKDTNIFFDTAKKVSESAKEYYTGNGIKINNTAENTKHDTHKWDLAQKAEQNSAYNGDNNVDQYSNYQSVRILRFKREGENHF